ncbi:NAD(P)H nitroreductase [Nocardia puris]|uniref:Nitroreductase n=1 Tax=Nocardia puris TaxID=208602 RepID=A0A366E148_9NOCA|nr:NAD(P)H nitroreductase [Nocardia puris]MBF6366277.1 NAD(P)H nitroreductase [Nocardia puris]MBF6458384.1 NAD(P)H nitroreductase [Nocardia puris]RBO96027.1 hypothetical protein DFR74_10138 [Nocardia puris]
MDGDRLAVSVDHVLTLAIRAPSVRNSQPWRFRVDGPLVHVYLDPARVGSGSGADRRDAVLSCGAVLHHLRIALATHGRSAIVRRLPDPADPAHLATVRPVRSEPTMTATALAAVIGSRRSDVRCYRSAPGPPGCSGLLAERAAAHGGVLRAAGGEGSEWLTASVRALVGACDRADLLVLGTPGDDPLSWLRGGEALSSVLLTAANLGLACCVLTEPFGDAALRDRVGAEVLGGSSSAQAIVRIGSCPDETQPLPPTSRRALGEVLDR